MERSIENNYSLILGQFVISSLFFNLSKTKGVFMNISVLLFFFNFLCFFSIRISNNNATRINTITSWKKIQYIRICNKIYNKLFNIRIPGIRWHHFLKHSETKHNESLHLSSPFFLLSSYFHVNLHDCHVHSKMDTWLELETIRDK